MSNVITRTRTRVRWKIRARAARFFLGTPLGRWMLRKRVQQKLRRYDDVIEAAIGGLAVAGVVAAVAWAEYQRHAVTPE